MEGIKNIINENKVTVGVVVAACSVTYFTGSVTLSVALLASVIGYVSYNNRPQDGSIQTNTTSLKVEKDKTSVTVEKSIPTVTRRASSLGNSGNGGSSSSSTPTSPVKGLPNTPTKPVTGSNSTPTSPPPPIPPRPSLSNVGGQLSSSAPTSPIKDNQPPPPVKRNVTQPEIIQQPSTTTPTPSPTTSSPINKVLPPIPSPKGDLKQQQLELSKEAKEKKLKQTSNQSGNTVSTLRGILGGVVKNIGSVVSKEPQLTPEEREKNEKKRRLIAEEILNTERVYVGKLRAITNVFYIPLKTAASANPHPPLTLDQVYTIFSEIVTIYNYNTHFLQLLEEKMKNTTSNIILGDTFISITDYLKTYTVYINNYSKAIATLEKARKNQNVEQLLYKFSQEPECDNLDLASLLIQPVQRVPRYILLLTELIKVTDKKSSEHSSLQKALDKMKALASDMNENRRQAELLNKMYEIQNCLDGFKGDFIIPARKLLMECDFQEKVYNSSNLTSSSSSSTRRYILCTDIILRTKSKGKKYIVKETLPISTLQFSKDVNGEILAIVSGNGDVLVLNAITPDDSVSASSIEEKWKETILNQQKISRDNERRVSIGHL